MANEFKIENGLIVNGDTNLKGGLSISGSVTAENGLLINGSLSATGQIYGYTNSTPIPADFPNSVNPSVNAGSTIFSTPKSIQEMFDIILYPTLFPTLTNPSSNFTLPQEGLKEVGTVITLNFTSTFNRGSVSPAYCGTSQFRSGSAEQYNYTGTNLPATVISNLNSDSQTVNNYEVLLGNQSWTSNVSYASGDQPKDSKCGDFSSPLIAGTTSTITKTINGVYPVYGTTSNITTLTKRPLQTMNQNITISLVNESGSDKQKVLIPQNWSNIVKLYQFNTFSQVYDEINLNTFTKTATSYFVNSNASNVNYWLYEHNGSGIGSRTLRFNVS